MGWEMAGENTQASDPDQPRAKKEPKAKKKRGCLFRLLVLDVVVAVAVALIVVAVFMVQDYQRKNATYAWPSSGIAQLLPQPASDKGEVLRSGKDGLEVEVRQTSAADYSDYLAACEDKGFTVDTDAAGYRYTAFNKEGYKLELAYYSSSEEMCIHLTAPIQMNDLSWPTMGPSTLVPVPEVTRGKLITDNRNTFVVEVGDMDMDAFNAYVGSCMAAGYDVDHNRTDTSYSACNADGAKVSVSYEGANIVRISVRAPKEGNASHASSSGADNAGELQAESAAESSETEASEQQDSPAEAKDDAPTATEKAKDALGSLAGAVSDAASGLVTPEFKETMDDYETFMNGYCDFMVKYTDAENSGDTASLGEMMSDYAALIQQEAEWIDKINAVDPGSLSSADMAYYLAVQGRVTQRLAEISQS